MSTGASITVSVLNREDEPRWTEFLASAVNATLFHQLDFLAYHPNGRFQFEHLVAQRGNKIVAVIPGGIVEHDGKPIYASPVGASIGGPAMDPDFAAAEILELAGALQDYVRERAWAGIEITVPPPAYDDRLAEALSFALFYRGFRMTNRWLCPMIPIVSSDGERYRRLFRDTYGNRVRAGRKNGITVVEGGAGQLDNFLPVFRDTYARHGVPPTHTVQEIADLVDRFPDRIQIWAALLNGEPVAGILVFHVNRTVAYTFYICTSASHARHNGPVVIFAAMIDALAGRGVRWVDLGPSAHAHGFNAGVTFFKEGLGATHHCRDSWTWQLPAS